jgi:putative transposase
VDGPVLPKNGGWHLEEHRQEALVAQALKKALQTRKAPAGMVVHADRGGQYAGSSFRRLPDKNQLRQSMSRADNLYDNIFKEALFSRFKAERLQGSAFQNKANAQTEIFEYIAMYDNPKRRHSALNYLSPVAYENNHYNSLT